MNSFQGKQLSTEETVPMTPVYNLWIIQRNMDTVSTKTQTNVPHGFMYLNQPLKKHFTNNN